MDLGDILTWLIILIPLIGKLIEIILKSAGKPQAAKKVEEIVKEFSHDDPDDEQDDVPASDTVGAPVGGLVGNTAGGSADDSVGDFADEPVSWSADDFAEVPVGEPVPAFASEAVPTVFSAPSELLEGGYRSIKDIINDRKSAMDKAGNDEVVKKEPIDPKKLVIYSEIMKPKYR